MTTNNNFDVIIAGGSYSGLAAAMALGRAMRKVLVIDAGQPCNRQTPQSHNFLTNDGKAPAEIAAVARLQVRMYDTVEFYTGTVINGRKTEAGFEIETSNGKTFAAKKLIFATGIKDLLPSIPGLEECWGISVIHCPYCHGYEYRNEKTGILGNGDAAFDFTRLIANWTYDLTLYTNGASVLTDEQKKKLQQHSVQIIEKRIERLEHTNGAVQYLLFKDGTQSPVKALYAPSPFEQHCKVPEQLGCVLTEEGYIKVDGVQETSVAGVYAAGDNAAKIRTVANAVSTGTTAGMMLNKKLSLDEF